MCTRSLAPAATNYVADRRDFARRVVLGCAKWVDPALPDALPRDVFQYHFDAVLPLVDPKLSEHQNLDLLKPQIDVLRAEFERDKGRWLTPSV